MTDGTTSPNRPLHRRHLLKTASVTLAGGAVVTTISDSGRAQASASITFNDQTSNGLSVTIARLETNQDAFVMIRGGGTERGRQSFPAGTVATDVEIRLTNPITKTMRLSASLFPEEGGSDLARDTARVTVKNPPDRIEGMDPTKVPENPDAGFNYPYFLYAPDKYDDEEPKPILVQPNNTGTFTDDFGRHLAAAKRRIEDGVGRQIADGLFTPLLIPVFPRPRTEPVNWKHYIHYLDNDTLAIDEGPLERVDLQLLAMVEDARKHLPDKYPVADGLMLNGFSAAGNFANRFAALHPSKVVSVTAGGVNGMPILPIETAKGYTLNYHVGIANLEALTGSPFDLDAFRDVNQFLYMGELDSSDTIGFDDSWTSDKLEDIALAVFGDDMQNDRFPYAKAVYSDVDAAAVFRIYKDAPHTPRPAIDDLITFHERTLAGDDIESIRTDLGGNVPNLRAYISYAPRHPTVGEQVAFDGSRSAVWDASIVAYEWEFSDGETATGALTTHTFDTSGGHNVRLTVTDDTNTTYQSVVQVVVEESETTTPTPSSDTTPTPVDNPTTTTSQTTSAANANEANGGFERLAGASALSGILGATIGYVIRGKSSNDTANDD